MSETRSPTQARNALRRKVLKRRTGSVSTFEHVLLRAYSYKVHSKLTLKDTKMSFIVIVAPTQKVENTDSVCAGRKMVCLPMKIRKPILRRYANIVREKS